jgi:hypothetical protein
MARRPFTESPAGAPAAAEDIGALALARARSLVRRLVALEDGPLRVRAAARALAAEAPAGAAELLAAAVRLAAGGESTLALALGRALLDGAAGLAYEHLAAIYAAATERGLDEVRALLVAPAPRRPFEPPRDRADRALAQMTLGHKKALARGRRDPDLLARLAAEGEPDVVRELLENPRLTEDLAVRVAARRPCRPEVLRCLAEHRRWRARPAVLRAIAQNPYAEPELVLKILPALGGPELAAIARDGSLHTLVSASAKWLGLARGGRAARGRDGGAT